MIFPITMLTALIFSAFAHSHESFDSAKIAEGRRLLQEHYNCTTLLQETEHAAWLERLGPNADIYHFWKGTSAAHAVLDTSYFDDLRARPVLFVGDSGMGKTWNLDAMVAFVHRHGRSFAHVSLRMTEPNGVNGHDSFERTGSRGRSDSAVVGHDISRRQRRVSLIGRALEATWTMKSPNDFVFVDVTTPTPDPDDAARSARDFLAFLVLLQSNGARFDWNLTMAISTHEFENMRETLAPEDFARITEGFKILNLETPKFMLSTELHDLFPGKTPREILTLLYP